MPTGRLVPFANVFRMICRDAKLNNVMKILFLTNVANDKIVSD
jgi:hypothetical protein